jgi:hypothetical protein
MHEEPRKPTENHILAAEPTLLIAPKKYPFIDTCLHKIRAEAGS